MSGPLTGLKVVDLSRILAGPYCTQMLGDMGAEIIKIEKPFAGDDTRFWGPPFLKGTGESAYYLSVNRNKKSVAVDITKTEGQNIILKLLEDADIFIENFKVGGLKKYGLDYESLKQKFPNLIYCSISGFGQNGPLSQEPGYDLVAQAMGGLMSVTGEPSGDPMKAGVAVSDILSGLHAAVAILSALHYRNQSGQGQYIDIALLDCTLAGLTNLSQYYLTSGHVAPRQGNSHSTIAPYQAFEAKDGWLVIAVGNNSQFEKFCAFLGMPHLAQEDRFKTNPARVINKTQLLKEISPQLAGLNVENIISACRTFGIPASPVNSLDQTFAEPQIDARKMKIKIGDIDLVGSPLNFSQSCVEYNSSPPILGQDTEDVLKRLGLSQTEIAQLAKLKIIQKT